MRNVAEQYRRESIRKYGRVVCSNCGREIKSITYDNVAHLRGRGVEKALKFEPENMSILCGPTDYWGEVDRSCHTLYDHKRMDEFRAKQKNPAGK